MTSPLALGGGRSKKDPEGNSPPPPPPAQLSPKNNPQKKQHEPSLAVPHISVPDIRWIDWKALRAAGFEAVVFDKDNTLTSPFATGGDEGGGGGSSGAPRSKSSSSAHNGAHPRVRGALDEARRVFGPERLALFSNSAGLAQYDPSGKEAEAVEEALGVRVLRHRAKKPAGDAGDLEAALGGQGGKGSGKAVKATRAVFVGDRYLTDVAYGNRHGMLTVRVSPLVTSRGAEPPAVVLARALEDALARRWRRLGVRAPAHALVEGRGGAAAFVRRPAETGEE
jgi:phosphatidylglycerophosphatase GEP4